MPHKAANPLEPNLTVWARNGGIEYWGGLQVPSTAMEAAEVIGGIPSHRVTLHELVSGGSFGARESKYWLFEATWLAVKTGKPVKLMNSREDEMRALFYHAASYHRARAVLDAQGNRVAVAARRDARLAAALSRARRPDGFQHDRGHHEMGVRVCGAASRHRLDPDGDGRADRLVSRGELHPERVRGRIGDGRGRARKATRRVPARAHARPAAPCGRAAWRRNERGGASRCRMVSRSASRRTRRTTAMSRWSRGSCAKDGAVRVEKLTCVADCGIAVSPAGVDEQLYGGLMWGSATRRPIASTSGTAACSSRTSIRIA